MIKNLFGKVLNFTKEHNRVSYRDSYEERGDHIRTERRTSFRQSYDDIQFDTRVHA